ncbi:hypothetical protein PMNALOAF_1218 [Methylobacterium adhaesivum]|uniref:Uncharacterized protein n=1 Tax=Methylobacterium adhaesivum TaxID=333297 RepID=A0ABT8BFU1_9HYPH|nr:hypothetical protein [Methylobacterium adhaesivum]MDN3590635.1 hypothetical protein [Methylobacterium adhaesivum]GJD29976.1 hypothetical protein PMNALOAF_1218 [Methylobacterium adhaesivum]
MAGRARPITVRRTRDPRTMLDLAFTLGGLAVFGLTAAYAALCERL